MDQWELNKAGGPFEVLGREAEGWAFGGVRNDLKSNGKWRQKKKKREYVVFGGEGLIDYCALSVSLEEAEIIGRSLSLLIWVNVALGPLG